MLSRNDSILNTGMSSATVTKLERNRLAREQRRQDKSKKKSMLLPAAEVVIHELEKEQNATILALLEAIDIIPADDEQFRAKITALKLYKESIARLKSRLSNILRIKEVDEDE